MSNERSEDYYIGPADFFFRKKSVNRRKTVLKQESILLVMLSYK